MFCRKGYFSNLGFPQIFSRKVIGKKIKERKKRNWSISIQLLEFSVSELLLGRINGGIDFRVVRTSGSISISGDLEFSVSRTWLLRFSQRHFSLTFTR